MDKKNLKLHSASVYGGIAMDFRKSLKAHVSNLKKKEHVTDEFLFEALNNLAGFCDYCPFCVSERPDFCNYEDEGCYMRKERYGKG